MKQIIRFFEYLAVLFACASFGWAVFLILTIFIPRLGVTSAGLYKFTVEQGDSVLTIASKLETQDIIRNKYAFALYAYASTAAQRLQAGVYAIKPGMSIRDIVQAFAQGDVLPESRSRKIRLQEGWTVREMGDYLESQNIVSAEDFMVAAGVNPDNVGQGGKKEAKIPVSYLTVSVVDDKPGYASLEGYLFPDTYEIPPKTTANTIVMRMLQNADTRITPELREEIKKQGKTIFEILTVASIIEEEVPKGYDRPMVAGIIYNRLRKGMPLQMDSTVNYFTGMKKRAVSIADTKLENPYNTYRNKGLPPTPIANPGISAIRAALYPARHDYYFFLSKRTGETVFSRTFAEHLMAKNTYL